MSDQPLYFARIGRYMVNVGLLADHPNRMDDLKLTPSESALLGRHRAAVGADWRPVLAGSVPAVERVSVN